MNKNERYGDLLKQDFSADYGDLFDNADKKPRKEYEDMIVKPAPRNYGSMLKNWRANFGESTPIRKFIGKLENIQSAANEHKLSDKAKEDFVEILENCLASKYFSMYKYDGKPAAFIFDNAEDQEWFAGVNPQTEFSRKFFSDFQSEVGEVWKNPCNYCGCNGKWLIFRY